MRTRNNVDVISISADFQSQTAKQFTSGEIEAYAIAARMDPSYLSFLFGGISVRLLALWASLHHSHLAFTDGKLIQSILWSLLALFTNHDLPRQKPS